jgi:hypothetical protein
MKNISWTEKKWSKKKTVQKPKRMIRKEKEQMETDSKWSEA